jgi:hypothetical protein
MKVIPILLLSAALGSAAGIDLHNAVIVTRPGVAAGAEQAAATVLSEEIEKRTELHLRVSAQWPASVPVIAITAERSVPAWHRSIPAGEARAEGYRLFVDTSGAQPVVWILGADARGTLYGAGNLLRKAVYAPGQLSVDAPLDIATAPRYAIRGHQLGYRAQANSYDAWTPAQFDQYIRELAFFGANSIEGIPFDDNRPTPVMKYARRDMNRMIGEICRRYGLDYWAWIPADFDLNDRDKRADLLARCRQFFTDTPEFTGLFFPGGDPGKNPPELVIPFLEDVWKVLEPAHPKARIWLSLQQFSRAQEDYVYSFIEKQSPKWLAGLVAGPSSRPLSEMRRRLPHQYQLRDYPDITHNKLSQYEVPQWDQTFALTLGREAVNPRPAEFAAIYHRYAAYTDGFISYSDGVHDDVNKTIWSALSWDPSRSVNDVLEEYANVFFESAVARDAADGILALERNWHGVLLQNGAVEATLLQWQQLEQRAPRLENNWRWQMMLLRANYDAYDRRRLVNESALEESANAILARADRIGADAAMKDAMAALRQAVDHPAAPDLRARIVDLCARLFGSIGLQTSVKQYYASGSERGAVLDFIDTPLNNRWWLEDQLKAIGALPSEAEKVARLKMLAAWEHPGPGSFYDVPGDLSKSPDVIHVSSDPGLDDDSVPTPTYWWWNDGRSRARLTWQITMFPQAIVYESIDPTATYVVRSTVVGQANLRINGERIQPTIDGKKIGEFKEFPVPAHLLESRRLVLTWDKPVGEEDLNWRDQSRLSEVWLIRQGPKSSPDHTPHSAGSSGLARH